MPSEFSEHRRRWTPRENRERDEILEKEERSERIREVLDGVFRELEHKESVEKIVKESLEELEEFESQQDRSQEIAREASEELREVEDELGDALDHAREELHEDFINDMESQLDGPSLKETKDESSEPDRDGETSETEESTPSYIEGGDGTVYVVETGGPSEGHAQSEVEAETEEVEEEEHREAPQIPEATSEVVESDESVKVRNSITRPEHAEVEEPGETVVPSEATEGRAKSSREEDVGLEDCTEESESEHKQKTASVPSEVEETLSPASEVASEEVTEPIEEPVPETTESVPEESEDAVEQDSAEVEETSDSGMEVGPEESGEVSDAGEAGEESVEVPEEIIRRVEELLEELDVLEEQEVNEPRVIIDAMTGERHIDHSLEPRPYFPETEEDREREEEERTRERLRELFARLTEEERERFKESVRREVESEEELEALVRRWRSRVVSPDFRQNLEDARQYVRSKKKGEVPRLIRELRALEVERAWASVVGEAARRSLERGLAGVVRSPVAQQQRVKKKRKTGYHRGREYTLRLHRPMCGKRPAGSFESYKKWLERYYPGVSVRSDYPALLEQLRKFFELRDALRGRTAVRQFEVDTIGARLGLKKSTAREWVLYGHVPHLFKIVGSSMSAREARRLLNEIVKRAGGIRTWSELELWLKLLYPDGAYTRIAQYRSKEARVREFFAFLGELERGGAQKDIARRSGISKRRVRAFTAGEVPWLIRHVLAQTGKLAPTERYTSHRGSTYRVKIRPLVLRSKVIDSYSEFKKVVDSDFPWLKERSDYQRLLHVVRVYFLARRKFGAQKHVTRKEIVDFAARHDVSQQTVNQWLVGISLPMVIDMLERALSVTEAKRELKAIHQKLNGIVSLTEYRKRMRTFYLLGALKLLPSHKKDHVRAKEFFQFLKALEKGGLYTDIIKRGRLNMANAKRRRLEHIFPRLVGVASSIPRVPPQSGNRWVALKVKNGKQHGFIQVPLVISDISDIKYVLDQLVPLKGRKMKDWTKRFGAIPRIIAFMYLLGAIISDGFFVRRNGISTTVGISLSANYSWSETFGEAFCYCLGILGFRAWRNKNRVRKNKAGKDIETMNWLSSASPFLLWIRSTLLGLRMDAAKEDQSIRAEWVLKIPHEMILPILQGVADGDGYASVRNMTAGIGTKHNKKFFQSLLSLLGIDSVDGGTGIVISKKESLRMAAELPLFKYAADRFFRLRELIMMIASMKHTKVSKEEKKRILEYHRQGIKVNQIGPLLWVDFGRARRSSTIQKVINDADS